LKENKNLIGNADGVRLWHFVIEICLVVAFIINNLIDQICYEIDLMKKNALSGFYHRDAHYYIIISHNTSLPMIGHVELVIGMLMSHTS